MRAKTIAVQYGRKFNLGDYNSVEISASMWADLEDGDTVENAYSAALEMCRNAVKAEYERIGNRGSGVSLTVKRRFAGAEVGNDTRDH